MLGMKDFALYTITSEENLKRYVCVRVRACVCVCLSGASTHEGKGSSCFQSELGGKLFPSGKLEKCLN